MTKPKRTHWEAVKHIFRYLKGTIDYQLQYEGSSVSSLQAYADANFAPDLTHCKSTMGYVVCLAGAPVIWKTTRQTSVARSTTDAETMALGHCSAEIVWLRSLLFEIDILQNEPTVIFGDNQSSLKICNNPVFHQRSKHMAIQYHYTRELVQDKQIRLEYCRSTDMLADILTKNLGREAHSRLVQKLGLR